ASLSSRSNAEGGLSWVTRRKARWIGLRRTSRALPVVTLELAGKALDVGLKPIPRAFRLVTQLNPPSAFERDDKLAARQDMTLDRVLKRGFGRARPQCQFGVQRVKLEVVVVGRAGRRTRSAVTVASEIVASLRASLGPPRAFSQVGRCGREVEHDPVHERLARSVGVDDRQRQAFRTVGNAAPAKWR